MKNRYAREFGLPVDQIKFFNELTPSQQTDVARWFNLITPANYVYAVKRDGNLVWRREKRDFLQEANAAR